MRDYADKFDRVDEMIPASEHDKVRQAIRQEMKVHDEFKAWLDTLGSKLNQPRSAGMRDIDVVLSMCEEMVRTTKHFAALARAAAAATSKAGQGRL